MDQLQVTV